MGQPPAERWTRTGGRLKRQPWKRQQSQAVSGVSVDGGFAAVVDGFDGVAVASGADPAAPAGVGVGVQRPAAFVFEDVMVLARRMQVRSVGAATRGIVLPVGALVVEVAVIGCPLAAREGAGAVAGFDEPGQFSRRLVGAVTEVEQVTGLRVRGSSAATVRRPPMSRASGGGDGSVAGEFGRVVLQAEQGGQINRHVAPPAVSRSPRLG